ncbi:MAG: YeeE/YedE family protein [Rhodobacteraceae bacterium]|nr:YeeE/YedE family protein [Paracoccaceae bacterium]
MDGVSVGIIAALIGLGGGTVLGLAARLGDFCTLGAIESAVYGNNQTRARMWGVALGVAILGTFALEATGVLALSDTIYHSLRWNPIASITGGLMFGYGMAFTGNCAFSSLARIGGGDLRALVAVIVIAIFSLITLGGPLAEIRVLIFPEAPATGTQSFAHLIAGWTAIPAFLVAAIIGVILLAWGLRDAGLRQRPASIFWAAMVGLAVVSGWWGMALLHEASLGGADVQSHSFTAPLGRSLIYLMTSTAGGVNFAVGSVGGVILGGALGSLIKGHFRWEACEDPRELGRQMYGAALMGIGGVIALGCTLGQGLTAFSTLAFSAPVTLAAIIIGALIGLRRLVSGFQPD